MNRYIVIRHVPGNPPCVFESYDTFQEAERHIENMSPSRAHYGIYLLQTIARPDASWKWSNN